MEYDEKCLLRGTDCVINLTIEHRITETWLRAKG
jgi:hypothetical protein